MLGKRGIIKVITSHSVSVMDSKLSFAREKHSVLVCQSDRNTEQIQRSPASPSAAWALSPGQLELDLGDQMSSQHSPQSGVTPGSAMAHCWGWG